MKVLMPVLLFLCIVSSCKKAETAPVDTHPIVVPVPTIYGVFSGRLDHEYGGAGCTWGDGHNASFSVSRLGVDSISIQTTDSSIGYLLEQHFKFDTSGLYVRSLPEGYTYAAKTWTDSLHIYMSSNEIGDFDRYEYGGKK